MPRSTFWQALVLFLYDTGSRISAALAVEPSDIDLDRGLAILRSDASKTGIEQVLRISPQTVSAIREIYDPQAKRVWHYGWNKRRIWVALHRNLASGWIATRSQPQVPLLPPNNGHTDGRRWSVRSGADHSWAYHGLHDARYVDQRAAPSQSAADVLPRPQFGEKPPSDNQSEHEASRQPTTTAHTNCESFTDALALVATLPLSVDERASAVRLLLAERTKK